MSGQQKVATVATKHGASEGTVPGTAMRNAAFVARQFLMKTENLNSFRELHFLSC